MTTVESSGTPSLVNLSKKMLKIMAEVGYVQKEGFNDFQKYRYAKESDIAAKVRESLIKHNVFAFSSVSKIGALEYTTKKGDTQFLVSVIVSVTFVDADSGESYTAQFPGDGADTGDKGIYKAITGAEKYALMKTFLIETGDDPEKDEPEQRAIKTGVIKPTDGAGDSLTAVQKEKVDRVLGTVIDSFEAGIPEEAYRAIDIAQFDVDEKTYLWSLLDSKQRSALKKIGAAKTVTPLHA